jgi:hypothetical protein
MSLFYQSKFSQIYYDNISTNGQLTITMISQLILIIDIMKMIIYKNALIRTILKLLKLKVYYLILESFTVRNRK